MSPFFYTIRRCIWAASTQLLPKRGTWHWRNRGFIPGLKVAWGMAKAYHYILRGQHKDHEKWLKQQQYTLSE